MKQFEEAAKKEQKERMEGSENNTMMKETMKDTLPANETAEEKGRTMRSPEEIVRLKRQWEEEHPNDHGSFYISDYLYEDEDDEDEEEEIDTFADEVKEDEEILEDGEKNRIPSNENACRMSDENVRRMTVYTGPTGGGKTYLLERMCNEVLFGACFPTDEVLFAAEPNTMGFLEELLFEGQAIGVEDVNLLTEKQQDLLIALLTADTYFRNPLTGEKMFIGENFELYGTLTDGDGEIPEKLLPYVNVQRVEFNAEALYKAAFEEALEGDER